MGKGLDDIGIEMLTGALGDNGHCLFVGERLLVHAFGHKSVKHVRHRHDTGRQRNFITLDSRGISRTIPFLMVIMGHVNRFVQVIRINGIASIRHHLRQDLPPFGRVALHDGEFLIGKLARLVQDQVGHGNFSDIVQRSRTLQFLNKLFREHIGELAFFLQLFRKGFHVSGSLLNVITGALVARFDDFSEFHNNHFLHLADSLRLHLHSRNKVVRIRGHGRERFVEVADFIEGLYLQINHPIRRQTNLFEVHLFAIHGACNHRRSRELHGGQRHAVHRNHDTAVHQLNNDTHDDNRKAEEQRQHLDEEHRLVGRHFAHVDIGRHIGNSLSGSIL